MARHIQPQVSDCQGQLAGQECCLSKDRQLSSESTRAFACSLARACMLVCICTRQRARVKARFREAEIAKRRRVSVRLRAQAHQRSCKRTQKDRSTRWMPWLPRGRHALKRPHRSRTCTRVRVCMILRVCRAEDVHTGCH